MRIANVAVLFVVSFGGVAACVSGSGTGPVLLDAADSGPVDTTRLADMGHDVAAEVQASAEFFAEALADADTALFDTLATGEFGWPCTFNGDCLSGYCLTVGNEKVCSSMCVEECPDGWSCVQDDNAAPDVIYLCVPSNLFLCSPCQDSADCHQPGLDTGSRCVGFGPAGSFCGAACQNNGVCPEGYSCQAMSTVDGGTSKQCVPVEDQPCECSDFAFEALTDCYVENDFGTCHGSRSCADEGLTQCDAQIPSAEQCNGQDDDCDGETDEEQGETNCGLGACEHTVENCIDGIVQTCDPLEGQGVEQCNGQDDDCNGETDEGFPDSDDDGTPDCLTNDDDGDGVADWLDNCPSVANPEQADFDYDTIGDACDPDDDDDKSPDEVDCLPFDDKVHPGPTRCATAKTTTATGRPTRSWASPSVAMESAPIP